MYLYCKLCLACKPARRLIYLQRARMADPGAAIRLTPAAAAAQDARIQEQHERAALNPVRAACPLTYACMGSKAVKLAGLDDKRQITVTVSGIYYR